MRNIPQLLDIHLQKSESAFSKSLKLSNQYALYASKTSAIPRIGLSKSFVLTVYPLYEKSLLLFSLLAGSISNIF